MLIKWSVNIYFCGHNYSGTFEIDDNASDAEVEMRTKDEVFNTFPLDWDRVFGSETIDWKLKNPYYTDGLYDMNGRIEHFDNSSTDEELDEFVKDMVYKRIGGCWRKYGDVNTKPSSKYVDVNELMKHLEEAAFMGWAGTPIVLFDQIEEIIDKCTL